MDGRWRGDVIKGCRSGAGMRHTSDAEALLWRTVLKCRRPKLRAQIHRLPSRSCGRHPVLMTTLDNLRCSETIRKNESSVMAPPTLTRCRISTDSLCSSATS